MNQAARENRAMENGILPYEKEYIIQGIWDYANSDIFNKENYIDKKLLIFWRIFNGFFRYIQKKTWFFCENDLCG